MGGRGRGSTWCRWVALESSLAELCVFGVSSEELRGPEKQSLSTLPVARAADDLNKGQYLFLGILFLKHGSILFKLHPPPPNLDPHFLKNMYFH